MHIYFFVLITGKDSAAVWTFVVPEEAINNPVAIKLVVLGLLTGHYM